MSGVIYDLAIIGGGINGCSIARDAAGRGLSVFLCEQGDLGEATSSASTKLIHGGLRYLEHFAFRLVRESLKEREVLLRSAPHIIRPMRFVLPYQKGMRPRAMLRAGLFLYDHLGGRRLLPPTRKLDLSGDPAGRLLGDRFTVAFEYSDCTVDDARLVVLNAIDARTHGASINPGVRCVIAEREGRLWRLALESTDTDERFVVMAKTLVNAAGPWVSEVLHHVIDINRRARIRMVKGSHIVVHKLFDDDRAYVFQNPDRRIVFAIPYEGDFTLIGTTDEDFHGDPADVAPDSVETAYLTTTISDCLRQPLYEDQIVWSYAGVRPLYDDGATKAQEATRDYVLDLDAGDGRPPLLSVFGGKITTSRRLAEQALDLLRPSLPKGKPWTAGAHLPGGSLDVDGLPDLVRTLRAAYPFVDERLARRLVRSYGTLAPSILHGARRIEDLGPVFGVDLMAAEVRHLVEEEWARTAEDILWRRSKLGLHMTRAEVASLEDWLAEGRDRSLDARIARSRA